MSTYFTDFSEYSTGVQPPDWTERYDTDGTVTVEADAGATGGQVLRVDLPSGDAPRGVSWDAVEDGNHDDVEVVAKFKLPGGGNTEQLASVIARANGSTGSHTFYRAAVAVLLGRAELAKLVSGSYSLLGSESNTLNSGDWWWARLRCNGTTIRARFWKDGTSEPGTWDVDVTDSGVSGTGWVGVLQFDGLDTVDYDVFGVGTNGDAAPTSSGPDKPTCFEESHNDTDVALSGSPYSGPNPHAESRWQVANQGVAYSTSTTHDSGWTASDLESHVATDTLPPGNPQKARVKYRDDQGNESPWSDDVLFTTAPPRPTGLNVSPQ